MDESLKKRVYRVITAADIIIEEIVRERGSKDYPNDKIESFWKNFFPKKDLISYLKLLSKYKDPEEIQDFKELVSGENPSYFYSNIIEGLLYDIDEDLSDTLSTEYIDEGSDFEN